MIQFEKYGEKIDGAICRTLHAIGLYLSICSAISKSRAFGQGLLSSVIPMQVSFTQIKTLDKICVKVAFPANKEIEALYHVLLLYQG